MKLCIPYTFTRMNTAYLLLGSNMGNKEYFLSQAIELFKKNSCKIIAKSSLYNTAPWPPRPDRSGHSGPSNNTQDNFLNQVLCVEFMLSADKLLETSLSIEKKLGRIRKQKWEARIIDIDILFFNSEIIQTPNLTIPHPYLHERRFALVPLAEIAEDFIHPILKKSVKHLLSSSSDNLFVIPHTNR